MEGICAVGDEHAGGRIFCGAEGQSSAVQKDPAGLYAGAAGTESAGGRAQPQPKAIVVGFVGGFVRATDTKHREVQFAREIRKNCADRVQAEVFENHEGAKALQRILASPDTNHDGTLLAVEKRQARIIIYGHSWGASETLALARELEQREVPVLLTIQSDSIRKPGQDDDTVPSNVARAIDFYQPHGLLHGERGIKAADPSRTEIIGNFRMNYKGHQVNCDAYRWYARSHGLISK